LLFTVPHFILTTPLQSVCVTAFISQEMEVQEGMEGPQVTQQGNLTPWFCVVYFAHSHAH
jgi:hypothetical protein